MFFSRRWMLCSRKRNIETACLNYRDFFSIRGNLCYSKRDASLLILPEGRSPLSRTSRTIKTASYGVMTKIIMLLFGFAGRTVFIYTIGTTCLGVNGLYSEIIRILSFSELGFGTALTFAMYRPVADGDIRTVRKLLRFYRAVNYSVAGIISVLGLCILPWLTYIVRGADFLTIRELRVYFLIFLFNTAASYFCTYKFVYLNALQRPYIMNNVTAVIRVTVSVSQILILLLTKNFLLYLLTETAILVISRISLSFYFRRIVPELNDLGDEDLTKKEREPIVRDVRGLIVHRLASIAVHSTDNLLISMLTNAGVVAVGFVSNYMLLIGAVTDFVTRLIGAAQAGLGNLAATESKERFHQTFLLLNFLTFWIYGFCASAIYALCPFFIRLWIGADKMIDGVSFALIVVNVYISGQESAFYYARIAKGEFNRDKIWAAVQAVVNMVVSVIAAKLLGLPGIYVGTVVSRLVYSFNRPRIMYDFLFGRSSGIFYRRWIMYFSASFLSAGLCRACALVILRDPSWAHFIAAMIPTAVIPNVLFILIFGRCREFAALKARALSYIHAS